MAAPQYQLSLSGINLPTFRGEYTESFHNFETNLNYISSFLNWSNETKLQCIPIVLHDRALSVFQNLTQSEKLDYNQVMTKLRAYFISKEK